jgi:hypothetical protein
VQVVFTSCGTESDNWVIYGAVAAARRAQLAAGGGGAGGPAPCHVVISAVEHPAVTAYLDHLAGLVRRGGAAWGRMGGGGKGCQVAAAAAMWLWLGGGGGRADAASQGSGAMRGQLAS